MPKLWRAELEFHSQSYWIKFDRKGCLNEKYFGIQSSVGFSKRDRHSCDKLCLTLIPGRCWWIWCLGALGGWWLAAAYNNAFPQLRGLEVSIWLEGIIPQRRSFSFFPLYLNQNSRLCSGLWFTKWSTTKVPNCAKAWMLVAVRSGEWAVEY